MKGIVCMSLRDCFIFLLFGYYIVFINVISEIVKLNYRLKVIVVVVFLYGIFLIFNVVWLI